MGHPAPRSLHGEALRAGDEFGDRDPGGKVTTLAMMAGEPVVVCWRERDFDEALSAAADMGLPVATTWSVSEAVGFYPDAHAGSAEELDQ